MKLLIAGGGTGGHVLAGVAVADAWCRRLDPESPSHPALKDVLFVGAAGGIEEKLVPKAGYALEVLKVGSLNRVGMSRKIRTLFQLPLSFVRSAWILIRFRPDAILGVGGYSSGPLVMVAWFLRLFRIIRPKLAILEQNSVSGMTNRILGRWVDMVFTCFPGLERQFPRKRIFKLGNPVRSAFQAQEDRRDPSGFTLLIFGGSQGALGINTLVLEALPFLTSSAVFNDRVKLIHQTGEKDYERVSQGYLKAGLGVHTGKPKVRVEKFIYEMPVVFAEASLLICRAGASTLSEVAAMGRAAILIPLPTAADNHQEKNAKAFCDVGAALLVRQQEAKGEDLAKLILSLAQDPDRRKQMEQAALNLHFPRAAEEIVQTFILK